MQHVSLSGLAGVGDALSLGSCDDMYTSSPTPTQVSLYSSAQNCYFLLELNTSTGALDVTLATDIELARGCSLTVPTGCLVVGGPDLSESNSGAFALTLTPLVVTPHLARGPNFDIVVTFTVADATDPVDLSRWYWAWEFREDPLAIYMPYWDTPCDTILGLSPWDPKALTVNGSLPGDAASPAHCGFYTSYGQLVLRSGAANASQGIQWANTTLVLPAGDVYWLPPTASPSPTPSTSSSPSDSSTRTPTPTASPTPTPTPTPTASPSATPSRTRAPTPTPTPTPSATPSTTSTASISASASPTPSTSPTTLPPYEATRTRVEPGFTPDFNVTLAGLPFPLQALAYRGPQPWVLHDDGTLVVMDDSLSCGYSFSTVGEPPGATSSFLLRYLPAATSGLTCRIYINQGHLVLNGVATTTAMNLVDTQYHLTQDMLVPTGALWTETRVDPGAALLFLDYVLYTGPPPMYTPPNLIASNLGYQLVSTTVVYNTTAGDPCALHLFPLAHRLVARFPRNAYPCTITIPAQALHTFMPTDNGDANRGRVTANNTEDLVFVAAAPPTEFLPFTLALSQRWEWSQMEFLVAVPQDAWYIRNIDFWAEATGRSSGPTAGPWPPTSTSTPTRPCPSWAPGAKWKTPPTATPSWAPGAKP